jgi:arylsulfatase A-like enzyme
MNLQGKFFYTAIALLCCILFDARGQKPYNILWITVEDMSPHLGCYGDFTVETPNIDRLASQGERFTNVYGTYGVCSPNRHTLITGMYPTSTGAMAMRTWRRTASIDKITDPALLSIPVYEATPPVGVKCFTEYLRAAGYYCTNNVKTDYQFRDVITAWDESSKTAHWRNRPDKETPFFAVFNNEVTHESGTFTRRSPVVTDRTKIVVPPYYPDTDAVREDMGRHYDNIYAMDKWVGEILKQLEDDHLLEKTIIFFFSDHGDGLPRAKRWVYDSGIKVPLIIRWPGGSGTINNELISFVDFPPTVLSLAGIAPPKYMEGQIFAGENRAEPRHYIYAFRDRMDPAPETIRAVRDKRFKYVRNYRPELPYIGNIPYRDQAAMMQEINAMIEAGKLGPDQWQFWAKQKPIEELYDTEVDPHEIHNLASMPQYMDKLDELRQAQLDFVNRFGDLGMIPETALIKKLWPPDGTQPTTARPEIIWTEKSVELKTTTEGASIAYRWSGDKNWRLYSTPIKPRRNKSIESVAVRIGWKPSDAATKHIE